MNRNNFIYLLRLNMKNNKLKNVIFTTATAIFLLLIIVFFSGKLSIHSFINNYLNSNFYYRIISVKTEDNLRSDNIQKIKELDISEIAHVYKSNVDLFHVTDIENEVLNINGSVELYGKYDGINYHINSGREIEKDNEIICSSDFYPGDFNNATSNDLINLKNGGLNQKYTISFDQNMLKKNNEYEVYKTYYYELKLVGTFDIKKDLTSYNFCYISPKFLEKILDESKTLYEDQSMAKSLDEGLDIIVLVNNYDNINKVINILNSNGFDASIYYELDTDFYTTISNVVIISSIIVILVSTACSIIFIKNILKENEKNIMLYEVLGFQKKYIKKLYFIQYMILASFSLIISIALSLVTEKIFYYIFSLSPSYSVLDLVLSYKEMIFCFSLLIVSIYISVSKLLYKNIWKNGTIRKLEE